VIGGLSKIKCLTQYAINQLVGRDLARLLRGSSKLSELEPLWAMLRSRSDHAQLLSTRTNHRFLQARLTPEMETQLKFILTQVPTISHCMCGWCITLRYGYTFQVKI
jgi:hypothetical protein